MSALRRKRLLLAVLLLLPTATLVGYWLTKRSPAEARLILDVVDEKIEGGKQVVVFRVGSTDARRVSITTMFVSRGPESDSGKWRIPQFTAGSPEGVFSGQREFGVVAPVGWPVWRLRANGSMEKDVWTRNKIKWRVLHQYTNIPGRPSNLTSTAQFLLNTNLVFLGATNQVLESRPITNTITP